MVAGIERERKEGPREQKEKRGRRTVVEAEGDAGRAGS